MAKGDTRSAKADTNEGKRELSSISRTTAAGVANKSAGAAPSCRAANASPPPSHVAFSDTSISRSAP
jgi:hypothetical protein